MTYPTFKPADIVLASGTSPLSRLIMEATDEPGEKAVFSHAGIFEAPDRIIEATTGGVIRTTLDTYRDAEAREHSRFAVYRLRHMTPRERVFVGNLPASQGWIGQQYGYRRLVRLGLDAFLGTDLAALPAPSLFQRGRQSMVCSGMVGRCYQHYYPRFSGKDWRRCTPDDIGDECRDLKVWECVYCTPGLLIPHRPPVII